MTVETVKSLEDIRFWMASEKATLDREISKCLILHDKVRMALHLIDEVRSHIGTRNERLGCLIYGESRSGKSRILKHYLSLHSEYLDPSGNRVVPVVLIVLNNVRTADELCMMLLKQLGDIMWSKGKPLERVNRLADYLTRLKVQVVMIDEAQHVVARGQETTLQATADFVKGLMEKTKCAFVLTGVASAKRFFDKDNQVRNRFMTPLELRLELNHNSTIEVNGVKGILTIIHKLQQAVTFFRQSDLYNISMGTRLCLATDGRIGLILDVLQDAANLAISDNRTSIDTKDLAKAYSQTIGTSTAGINPFTADASIVASALQYRETAAAREHVTNKRVKAKKREVLLNDVISL